MVDIQQPGDYPIILGDSLKDNGTSSTSYIGIKYNWLPKTGLEKASGKLKRNADGIALKYENGSDRYEYSGWSAEQPDHNHELAMFYDREKSAFVLERIGASLELNLKAGTGVTSEDLKRRAKLRPQTANNDHENNDDMDGAADPSNPFDYRHFLGEAREAADRISHHNLGGGTPVPGARTPMSGLTSPLIGASHHPFQSNTPQFGPLEIFDATNKETNEYPKGRWERVAKSGSSKTKTGRKAQAPKRPRATSNAKQAAVLSESRIVDSDSDDEELSDRPSPAAAAKIANTTQSKKTGGKVQASANDGGPLSIEETSPATDKRRKGHRINSNASRAGADIHKNDRPVSRESNTDIDVGMPDADEDMKYFQDDDDDDHDGDVDELVLDEGPARSPSPAIKAPKPRRKSSVLVRTTRDEPVLSRAQRDETVEDDEDEDEEVDPLAADLEAAMARELEGDYGRGEGVGLGIGMAPTQEDESDISEEE